MTSLTSVEFGAALPPILKLEDDLYVEWSSISDRITCAYTKAQVREIIDLEIAMAEERLSWLKKKHEMLETTGSTYRWDDWKKPLTPEEILEGNRQGQGEKSLTYNEMVEYAKSIVYRD